MLYFLFHFFQPYISFINSNITSYIDIDSINLDASGLLKDLFVEGLDSVIDERCFIKILQEHIGEETFFNNVTDIDKLFTILIRYSRSMKDNICIQGQSRTIEEWHLFYPQDISHSFLQHAGNYFGNNTSFVVNSSDEVVVLYKRGFENYECVLNDKSNIAQLKYSDSYSPFSCSISEQRFREESCNHKDN